MKIKIFVIAFLLITSFSFIYFSKTGKAIKTTYPPAQFSQGGWGDKFYIGAMNDDDDYYYSGGGHWEQIDMLGFNLWHKYVSGEKITNTTRWYPAFGFNDRVPNDLLTEQVDNYKGAVLTEIENIYSHNGGRKLIVMRPKIEWLCYGQRSDYQCEDTQYVDSQLWFYAFNSNEPTHVHSGISIRDTSVHGDNQYVKYCQRDVNQTDGGAGWVVDRLKANSEQCRRIISDNVNNQWQGDSECDWIIKPRIRIPQSFVVPANYETPICRIKVIAQDNYKVLKETVIKAKYFRVDNGGNNYYGDYIEEFNIDDPNVNLTIHGDWLGNETEGKWSNQARGNHQTDQPGDNKADIQVYWYGNCDMWIDYVRVDNDVADRLLGTPPDPDFEQWIEEEVHYIGVNTVNGEYPILKYYMELCEFNNLPCMAYVNEKLKYWSNFYSQGAVTIDLLQDKTNMISAHVPWDSRTRVENVDFLYNYYVNKIGLTQIFAESYPMTACYTTETQSFSKIPNTLPTTNGPGVLAEPVLPSEYDAWLQDNLNHKPYVLEGGDYNVFCGTTSCGGITSTYLSQDLGNFRYTMQTSSALSKRTGLPFIFMPQAHQWFRPGEVRREPTNEELDMMANVAVSYGAKGLIYFQFPGGGTANDCIYDRGLIDSWRGKLREENYYQETKYKWQVIKDIVTRLSDKWGSYLMSFDNTQTNSYIYDFEDERTELTNPSKSYFKQVITYRPGTLQPSCPLTPGFDSPPNMIFDCQEYTYVQVATFKQNSLIGEPNTKFFMIVNRRCAPFKNDANDENHGGKRDIHLVFHANHAEFAAANSWDIIDLANPTILVNQFDKRNEQPIDLGADFSPGEGRLYKIVPTAQHGGNLICDENITGQEFTCLNTVYNSGHNITIGSGTTINFTDSSKIIMNRGTFQMGDPNYNGAPNISIGASSGNQI